MTTSKKKAEPKSFTIEFPGITNLIGTQTLVSSAPSPLSAQGVPDPELAEKYIGIWDTGATRSAVTKKVASECNLKPIGKAKVLTASGEHICDKYLVNIFLPHVQYIFPNLVVNEVDLRPPFDILIGMDIISQSDFAITNMGGKTTFSFNMPSSHCVDFTGKKAVASRITPPMLISHKIGRNDPCPCGSGKKYKKCCGK